ncbi:MAG TPA: hypothetical protein VLE73_05530 [Candidatus Saccharimonadales bacterium]|nr:hypothetical protein [Candidatus Saccharimonadales bacterium]
MIVPDRTPDLGPEGLGPRATEEQLGDLHRIISQIYYGAEQRSLIFPGMHRDEADGVSLIIPRPREIATVFQSNVKPWVRVSPPDAEGQHIETARFCDAKTPEISLHETTFVIEALTINGFGALTGTKHSDTVVVKSWTDDVYPYEQIQETMWAGRTEAVPPIALTEADAAKWLARYTALDAEGRANAQYAKKSSPMRRFMGALGMRNA